MTNSSAVLSLRPLTCERVDCFIMGSQWANQRGIERLKWLKWFRKCLSKVLIASILCIKLSRSTTILLVCQDFGRSSPISLVRKG